MDFPYDWSNPHMDINVFIFKVLERGYFRDKRIFSLNLYSLILGLARSEKYL